MYVVLAFIAMALALRFGKALNPTSHQIRQSIFDF
jgi:hypothetical protein